MLQIIEYLGSRFRPGATYVTVRYPLDSYMARSGLAAVTASATRARATALQPSSVIARAMRSARSGLAAVSVSAMRTRATACG